MSMIYIVFLILTIVITFYIFRAVSRNSVGTTFAYIKRFFLIWLLVLAGLGALFGYLGIL